MEGAVLTQLLRRVERHRVTPRHGRTKATRTGATARALAGVIIALYCAGCTHDLRYESQFSGELAAIADSVFQSRNELECMDRSRTECVVWQADTAWYFYSTPRGELLTVAREVDTDSASAVVLAAEITQAMRRAYGREREVECELPESVDSSGSQHSRKRWSAAAYHVALDVNLPSTEQRSPSTVTLGHRGGPSDCESVPLAPRLTF